MEYYKPLASEDAKTSVMAENSLKAESSIMTEIPTMAQIAIMAEISAKAENAIKSSKPKMLHSCEICGKKCDGPSKLKVHKRIHTGEKSYSCSYCTVKFKEKHHMNRHEKVHSTRGHEMKTEESKMIHFCSLCRKDLVGRETYEIHLKVHKEKMHLSCEHCGKVCSSLTKLKIHRRIHTGEKPYSCKYCTLKFRQKSHKAVHEKIHVAKEHKFESEKSKYNQFKKLKNNYECEICQKAVATPSKLIIHKRIHTGEKPYSCKFCTLKFRQKSHKVGHEKIHVTKEHKIESDESKMIHFCNYCNNNKDFIGIEAYKVHMKKHKNQSGTSGDAQALIKNETPTESEISRKTESLEKSENVTKSSRPKMLHSCEICGKKCNGSSKLKVHKRIHTGEKPYSCSYCTLNFRHKSNMNSHEKVHIFRGHEKKTIESEMFHFCKFCRTDFIGVQGYLVHMKKHSKLNDQLAVEKEIKKRNISENHYETSENQNEVCEEQNGVSDDPVTREELEKTPKCKVCNVYTMYNMYKYQFTHTLVKQKFNCSQHENVQIVDKGQDIKPKEFEIYEDSLLEDIYEIKPETLIHQQTNTGKSLSEALIFASANPKFNDRLFIELQVQYMKIPSSNLGKT